MSNSKYELYGVFKTIQNIKIGSNTERKIVDDYVYSYNHYGKTFYTKMKWVPQPYFINGSLLPSVIIPPLENNKILISKDWGPYGAKNFCGEFTKYREFMKWYNRLYGSQRVFYEVIKFFAIQKFKFDIDFKFDDEKFIGIITDAMKSLNFKEFIIRTIWDAIIHNFKECFGIDIGYESLYTYDSSTSFKFSFHIVVQNYHVSTAFQAKAFCEKVINSLMNHSETNTFPIIKELLALKDEEKLKDYRLVSKLIDTIVYSNPQNFRAIRCCKQGKNNFKVPCEMKVNGFKQDTKNMDDIDSFVGYIRKDSILLKDIVDDQYKGTPIKASKLKDPSGKKLGTNQNFTYPQNEESVEIEKFVENVFPNIFGFRNIQGPFICFSRLQSSNCKLCDRVHDNDGAYCVVKKNGEVHFYCRRDENKNPIIIGALKCETLNGNKEGRGDFDRVIPKREFDIGDNKMIIENIKQYIGKLPKGNLIISGYMGCGKTTALEEIVKNAERVLILSPRKKYADATSVRVNIPSYDDPKYKDCIDQMAKLVLSMESLHKLKGNFDFDVVLLDEATSCFAQFLSPHMKFIQENIKIFELLMRRGKRIILADAFIMEDSTTLMKNLNLSYTFYNHITEPEIKRKCFEIPMKQIGKGNEEKYTLEPMYQFIIETLHKDENGYFVCVSKTKLLEFMKIFKKEFPDAEANFFYSGDTDNKNIFKDVNKHWTHKIDEIKNIDENGEITFEVIEGGIKRLIVTSLTNTVGVNYNIVGHFHNLFIYGGPGSGPVRDLFQASMRVRHITSNTMYYSLHPLEICSKPGFVHEDAIRLNIENSELWWKEITKDVNSKMEYINSKWVEDLIVFKLLEKYNSQEHYNKMFKEYLKFCYYENPIIKKINIIKPIEIEEIDTKSYNEIPNPKTSIEPYKFRVFNKEASDMDKLIYQKHEFNENFKSIPLKLRSSVAALYDSLYVAGNKKIGSYLKNMRYEMTGFNKFMEMIKIKDKDKGKETIKKERMILNKNILYLNAIEKLCKELGMKSTFEKCIIESKTLRDISVDSCSPQLIMDIGLRKRGKKELKNPQKSKLRDIKNIIENWTGGKFEMIGIRKQTKKNKIKIENNDYSFEPLEILVKTRKYIKLIDTN
jgi:hypothetical protein